MKQLAIHGGIPVRSIPLYYGHQYIDDNDIKSVTEVLKSDFLTCGPKIRDLEQELCNLTGVKYALVVSNGTAALHAACASIGIGPGDEVITTPITFAASANCILYCGARPVFADIDPDTYNISPKFIREKITSRTKAIVAVDFTGQAVQLSEIQDICEEYHLTLIEDAAHSIGTKYKTQMVGGIADLTTFSFHPVKTVTAGEGGAILTNHKQLYQKLQLFRTHGITHQTNQMKYESDGPWYYEQIDLGYNYRMTDIQAALLLSQLKKLSQFSRRRKEIVKQYNQAFSQLSGIIVQHEIPESNTTRHLYVIQIDTDKLKCTRNDFYVAMKAENIICNVHYIPVYYFPYYQSLGYRKEICPNAEQYYGRALTLPLYYGMTQQDVTDVIEAVTAIHNYYLK